MRGKGILETLRGGLIVSCQAEEGSPLRRPEIQAALARCAERAGAVGIRANGPEDVAAIRQAVNLPLVGLWKRSLPDYGRFITPTFAEAQALAAAGAEIIALDATERPRPEPLPDLIRRIQEELGCLVLADISTLAEGLRAVEEGADAVATTLSGYTPQSPAQREPDLVLVERLAAAVPVPVLAEGRYHRPEWATEALRRGAWAVVVGTAITDVEWIARQFVEALRQEQRCHAAHGSG